MRKPYRISSVVIGSPVSVVTRLIRSGTVAPKLVIGVPVGFVDAKEAKDELMAYAPEVSGMEFISTSGRKGGSTVAVAILNALIIMAAEGMDSSPARRSAHRKEG